MRDIIEDVDTGGGYFTQYCQTRGCLFLAGVGKDRFWIQLVLFLSCVWRPGISSGGMSKKPRPEVGAIVKTWNARSEARVRDQVKLAAVVWFARAKRATVILFRRSIRGREG